MTAPEPPTTRPTARATKVWPTPAWFLTAFYLTAVVWGIRGLYYWHPSGLDFWLRVSLAVTLAWWAACDARRRGRALPCPARFALVAFAEIAVPIYFIWTRRWRGLGWVLLHAFCWWVVSVLAMYGVGLLLPGPA